MSNSNPFPPISSGAVKFTPALEIPVAPHRAGYQPRHGPFHGSGKMVGLTGEEMRILLPDPRLLAVEGVSEFLPVAVCCPHCAAALGWDGTRTQKPVRIACVRFGGVGFDYLSIGQNRIEWRVVNRSMLCQFGHFLKFHEKGWNCDGARLALFARPDSPIALIGSLHWLTSMFELETKRPLPPESLWDVDSFEDIGGTPGLYLPAPDLERWIRSTFIEGSCPLVHEVHAHLEYARLGCLWTNEKNTRHMWEVLAETEVPFPQGPRWKKGRQEMQLRGWFGEVPDFIFTFYAPWATAATDDEWCAVVEHELCHAGQRRDDMGNPMITEDGLPRFGLRGHDVEEFVHVVERYGVGNGAGLTAALVRAAMQTPSVSPTQIEGACGTKGCGHGFRLVA